MVIPFRSLNGANGGVTGGPRGLAGPQASWTWQFQDGPYLRVRPGLSVTLHAQGNFWLEFAAGALYGNRVYASLVDGSAVSGRADNAEPTPFYVVSETRPGGLAAVSSAAIFSP